MKAIMAGALMALSVTAAGAAEDETSANRWLPLCKDFPNSKKSLTL
jgi:hypothetical protein